MLLTSEVKLTTPPSCSRSDAVALQRKTGEDVWTGIIWQIVCLVCVCVSVHTRKNNTQTHTHTRYTNSHIILLIFFFFVRFLASIFSQFGMSQSLSSAVLLTANSAVNSWKQVNTDVILTKTRHVSGVSTTALVCRMDSFMI